MSRHLARHARLSAGLLTATLALLPSPASSGRQAPPQFDPLRDSLPRDEPQAVYGPETSDAWNRLFYLLFTRTLETRVLAEGWTTARAMGADERAILTGLVVKRIEGGDRAIDPLYPSWLWMGSSAFDMTPAGRWGSLKEPRYSQLTAAVKEVRQTAAGRPALARALMQADLWAAYDMFHAFRLVATRARSSESVELSRRAEGLLPLLADTIRDLALSRAEIATLPDTYDAGVRAGSLPDLLGPRSAWLEMQPFADRMHERAVSFRRAARVFVKPTRPPSDAAAFLNRLRDNSGDHSIDAVALVIQVLLISSDGDPVPSPLTYEVQIRRAEGVATESAAGHVLQFELSRKSLLARPAGVGLMLVTDDAPAYLPFGGTDFSFAPQRGLDAGSISVSLRDRCAACHGAGMGRLLTFSIGPRPGEPVPSGEVLTPSEQQPARRVAERKMTLDDFRSLRQYWQR